MDSDTADPTSLLLAIAGGDGGAVQACIDRYSPLVWSIVRGLVRDVAAAEDTVQEVFIDLWRSAARFDPSKASEATFIATVARRRAIDRRRRIGRRPGEEELVVEAAGTDDGGLDQVEVRDEAALAREVLGLLRPEQRRVIELAILQGWTQREISERTGMPLGTVKSHVRRGLEQVTKELRARRGEAEA